MSPTYVIPKQGNWFNVIDNMPETLKVDTWCAFQMGRTRRVTESFYDVLTDGTGSVPTAVMVTSIKVQLVGTLAEYGVQSMTHWGLRNDLLQFLSASGMAFLPAGLGEYFPSDFAQDGANTVFAYNSEFEIEWLLEIPSTQSILNQVNLPSGIVTLNASGYVTIVD